MHKHTGIYINLRLKNIFTNHNVLLDEEKNSIIILLVSFFLLVFINYIFSLRNNLFYLIRSKKRITFSHLTNVKIYYQEYSQKLQHRKKLNNTIKQTKVKFLYYINSNVQLLELFSL